MANKILKAALVLVGCLGWGLSNGQTGSAESALTGLAPTENYADEVYLNGAIYTVNPDQPWAEAIAIKDHLLTHVGTGEDVKKFIGEKTKVIDLGKKMVMPGIHDSHTHLGWAGLYYKHECRLPPNASQEEIIAALKSCKVRRPGGWITAGVFSPEIFADTGINNQFLNEAFPDTPVYLVEYSIHHGLANAKALELAGITPDTPNPAGGIIARNSQTGELTGELIETANSLIHAKFSPYPEEVYKNTLKWAVKTCNEHGITSVQEASAARRLLKMLKNLDESGELTLRVTAHIVWKYEKFADSELSDLQALREERHKFASPRVDTRHAKMWLDGAPLPPYFTQATLNPDGEINPTNLLFGQNELETAVTRLDREDITVKMHVGGNGAARQALNAIAEMRSRNPASGLLHQLSHAGDVHSVDIARMRELGVVAEMSPAIWHLGIPSLSNWFDFRAMEDNDVLMVVGSDWIITPTPNLFPALEGMLDRGEKSVTLEEALRAMTINGAKAARSDHLFGSIELGKKATFIVLNQNLFDVPVEDISETLVEKTVFEGRLVYARSEEKN